MEQAINKLPEQSNLNPIKDWKSGFLGWSLAITCLSLITMWFFHNRIIVKTKELATINGKILGWEQRRKNLHQLSYSFAQVQPQINEVENLLPKADKLNILLEKLNQIALNNQVTTAIDYTISQEARAAGLNFNIKVFGSSDSSLLNYLRDLETGNYLVQIDNIIFTREAENNRVIMSLGLKIYVDETFYQPAAEN